MKNYEKDLLKISEKHIKKRNDFLSRKFVVDKVFYKKSDIISLKSIYEKSQKRYFDSIIKRNSVIANLNSEEYSVFFITLTTKDQKKFNNVKECVTFNIKQNLNFQRFYREFFKIRFFKKVRKEERFYIKVSEFTKNNVLHSHFLFAIKKEFALEFLDKFFKYFAKNTIKSLNVGRTEILVEDEIFDKLKNSSFFNYKKMHKSLFLNKEAYDFFNLDEKNDRYFYIKKLEKNSLKNIVKYASKYVVKNIKYKNEASIHNALYFLTRIRRINYSRSFFPQIFLKFENKKGKRIFEKYSFEELSRSYREKKIKIKRKVKDPFSYLNKRKDIYKKRYLLKYNELLADYFKAYNYTEEEKEEFFEVDELFSFYSFEDFYDFLEEEELLTEKDHENLFIEYIQIKKERFYKSKKTYYIHNVTTEEEFEICNKN
jgi:hypothetical protein